MKIPTVTSTVFRKTYPTMELPTFVTVNGHIIGTWVPLQYDRDKAWDSLETGQPTPSAREAQAARDFILRKINKGG